ncbi:CPBP family glutamic-type intramembrane protease [Bacillus sp. FJAT-27445]|uniref:CPBP family glutamic-type intramembrane protease n=1 Tax=Bacillus sp. FJAT-27445 TaxID=1679166 RepID=UPI000744541D|nr:CPBP family glutamic-type intramembrane protease [Bacillus sp. FJAT-27445]
MINDLVQPVSKRLFVLMLLVTVGSEAVLYLSRYSYFFSDFYNLIMVASIFLAWKLHPRFALSRKRADRQETGGMLSCMESEPYFGFGASVPKRQIVSQFAVVFLLFYLGAIVINFYSNILYPEFNQSYTEYVEESASIIESGMEGITGEDAGVNPVLEWFDLAGYDFLSDTLAGFEEVYRISYMILFLLLVKRIFPQKWAKWPEEVFLMAALFISSLLFGIGHTLANPQPLSVTVGTIATFTDMGLILGLLLLWTRNLWLLIAVHSVYDILMTIQWYYFEWAALLFSGVLILAWAIETGTRKKAAFQETSIKMGE